MSEHLKTIQKVKQYINEEDYLGLTEYIEKREIEVRESEDKSSKYIDKLVKELKWKIITFLSH